MELDSPTSDEDVEKLMDDFLEQNGHTVEGDDWDEDYNKKKCPDCGGIHDETATGCTCCGWSPSIDNK